MKRILVALGLAILGTASAFAQSVGMPSVGGYWSTTACGTGPSPCFVQYGATVPMGGNAASAATDSGNPVKVGGVYNSSLPTFTTGQRGDLQIGSRGSLHVEIWGNDAASAVATSTAGDGASNAGTGMYMIGRNSGFNGATWDRSFTCPSSASVSVTAAATTQIVALSASTIIRVCSFTITGSAAGTAATWVYGTGSNCATGQVALSGAMLMPANGPISATGMNGSLFRGAAGNALCLTAATGNVTGFVTYAQY